MISHRALLSPSSASTFHRYFVSRPKVGGGWGPDCICFLSCHQTALEIGLRQSWRVKPDFKTRIIYFQELNSDASPKKAVCEIVLPTQTGGLKRHERMTVRHSAL